MAILWLIARRELSETFGTRGNLARLALLVVGLPLIMLLLFIRPGLAREPADATRILQFVRILLLQFGFMPMGSAMLGAATSFALEFEAGTLIPLLATPVPTWAIFRGKLAVALTTGVSLGWLAQAVFVLSFQAITGFHWPLPLLHTALMAAIVGLGGVPLVAAATLVGSRVRRVRPAQQFASLIFLPVFIAVLTAAYRVSSASVTVFTSVALLWLMAGVVLIVLGERTWEREELLSRP